MWSCFGLQSEIPRLPVRTIDADCASIRLIIRYFVGDVNAWGGVMNYSKQNRVVVATDRTAIPAAVHAMLMLEFDVVSVVYDADTLLSEALRLEPDLVVVEAALSLRDDFRATGEIMRRLPRTKIIHHATHHATGAEELSQGDECEAIDSEARF